VTKNCFTEQIIPTSEVPKKRDFINTGLSSDFSGGSALKTIAGKHPLSGLKDALASELAVRTGARCGICVA
jgi:hypothetical protein